MEGPSLVILSEELKPFLGKKVVRTTGNSKQVTFSDITGKKLTEVMTWGKHLILRFGLTSNYKIHFLMFGSYRINEQKPDRIPRLCLQFSKGTIYFYTCSIKPLDGDPKEIYDFSVDPMSASWDEKKAIKMLRSSPTLYVCDALMDQTLFSGVGNIIKNEVLYRLKLHPLTRLGNLTPSALRKLVRETRTYCFQFFEWKKNYVLKKNWQIYRKRTCPKCLTSSTFGKTGKLARVSFFCPNCQPLVSRNSIYRRGTA